MKQKPINDLIHIVCLGLIYFITAKIGLMLDAVSGFATVVWPPTGLSLAALLLFGYRLWPGILLGAFLINFQTGAPFLAACGIALGNTLEAVTGTFLLQRFGRFQNSLERIRDVTALILLGALLSTMVSAAVGVGSLWAVGIVSHASFYATVRTWWIGDMLGALVVLPLLLSWLSRFKVSVRRTRLFEAILLALILTGISIEIFGGFFSASIEHSPVSYILFLPIIWAALRFGPKGASLATFALSSFAVWGTVNGFGPFARNTLSESLFFLQTFMGVAAVAGLIIASAVAERLSLTDTLRQNEERLRALIESSPAGILAIDNRGEIIFFNAASEKMFGYQRSEVIGRTIELLLPAAFRSDHIRHRAGFLANPQVRQMGVGRDLKALRKNGSEFPVEIGLSPVKTEKGTQVIAFITDITIRKQIEENLVKTNEELQRVNEVRAEFTSIVSHELRTPLQSIKEGIDIVLEGIDGPVNDEQKDTLGISKSNVDRLARLIDNVLDYSKLDAGKMEMEFETVNLNDLVHEVCGLMKLEVHKKGLDCQLEIPSEPLFGVVDADKIKQVLINLIHNALKFTEQGKICMRLGKRNGAICLEVEDTGAGIRKEDQSTIFEMFSQASDLKSFRAGGTGIGLAVCKLIVDQHKGQISLASEPGKGSKFTITLPQRLDSSAVREGST